MSTGPGASTLRDRANICADRAIFRTTRFYSLAAVNSYKAVASCWFVDCSRDFATDSRGYFATHYSLLRSKCPQCVYQIDI